MSGFNGRIQSFSDLSSISIISFPNSCDRLYAIKRHRMSLYRAGLLWLYEYGYISDPLQLDDKEVLRLLLEEGIKEVITKQGVVDLSEEGLKYLSLIYKNDTEKSKFLETLYYVFKNREDIRSIDSLYNLMYSPLTKKIKSPRIGMKVRMSKFILSQVYNGLYFRPVLLNMFIGEEEDVGCTDIRDIMWRECCLMLGVPESEICDDGLFDCRLSHEDEVASMEVIFDGLQGRGGRYSDLLDKWHEDNSYKSGNSHMQDRIGLFSLQTMNKTMELARAYVDSYNNIPVGCSFLLPYGYSIYYAKGREYCICGGSRYIVSCDSSGTDIMPDISEYVSYSGEVYSEELLSTAGEEYSNCPMVFSFFGKKGLYYDKVDTSMGGTPWVSMNKSMHIVDLYRYLSKYTSYQKELSLKIARNRENIDTLIYRIDADELVER